MGANQSKPSSIKLEKQLLEVVRPKTEKDYVFVGEEGEDEDARRSPSSGFFSVSGCWYYSHRIACGPSFL